MAVYVTNLEMKAGCDFYQEFYLTNPDLSPMDITGVSIHATLQKHPGAVDANSEFSDRVYTSFETEVIDGLAGIYAIKLSRSESIKLEEGKYVYDVVRVDDLSHFIPASSGLVFVDTSFGFVETEDDTPDPDTEPGPDPISPPGSGGDDGGPGSAPGGDEFVPGGY